MQLFEDLKADTLALSLFLYKRLESLISGSYSADRRIKIVAAVFNELVTCHSEKTLETMATDAAGVAAAIEALGRSRENAELVSVLIDSISQRDGTMLEIASKAARLHGIYIETSERKLKTIQDVMNTGLKVEGSELRQRSMRRGSGCLVAVLLFIGCAVLVPSAMVFVRYVFEL